MKLEDFWEKAIRKGASECWDWIGSRTTAGYGNLRLPEGRTEYAHRVAYLRFVGPIPDGFHVDHLCRNRACVNPSHLEAVTPQENWRRGLRSYEHRTTCRHGHDITDPANVYTRPCGKRQCRTCDRQRDRARRERST